MPKEGTGQLGVIYEQIMAGDESTLFKLGDKCNEVLTALNKVIGEMPDELGTLQKKWTGPASKAFNTLANQVLGFVEDTAEILKGYQPALNSAGAALKVAKDDIQKLASAWNKLTAEPDMASWDAAAEEVLKKVSDAYAKAGDALKEIPADPGDVDPNGGGADGDAGGDDKEEPDDGGAEDGDADDGDAGDDVPEDGDAGDGAPEDGGAGDGAPDDGGAGDGAPGDDPAGGGAQTIGPPELNTGDDGTGDGGGDGEPGGGAGAPIIGGVGNPALTTDIPGDSDDPDDVPPPELRGEGAPTGDAPTKLTSLDPATAGAPAPSSLVGSSAGGAPPTTLTNAPNAGGGAAGAGIPAGSPAAAGGGGRPFIGLVGPGSQLTSAGPRERRAGPPSGADGGRGVGLAPFAPGAPMSGAYGRGDAEEEERETWLVGDEEWDDTQVVDTSIGRPANNAG